MYKDLTQEAATLTKWLIGIPSVTGTAGEAVAIKAIYDGLMEFPYFKRHPEHLHYIPHEDQKNSSLMALVKAHDPCEQTIVLISNVDTAGAESFGSLKPLACQVGQLKEKLKSLNIIGKKDKDIEGNLYGLGSYECKGALGSLIALVKEFSDDTLSLDFNIVFLCLSCSYQDLQGMRACSGYLSKLITAHQLKPVLSLSFKPNFPEHQDDDDLHLYTGNLGVCEPSFFILGKGAAAGRPFSGFSPTLIASSIIKKMELNSGLMQKLSKKPLVPSFAHIFSRSARNHQSPDAVQISFNLTFSSLDLGELIEYLKEIACDAVMECSDLIDDRQIYYQYQNSHNHIPEVKDAEILSYTDLFERAKHHYKGNLAAAVQALADKCRTEGLSERECCFCIIERLNELSHLAKPSVVVFMGPGFIPAQGLRSQDQHDRELIICLKNTLNRMEQSSPGIPTLSSEYPSCDGNLMRPLGLDDAGRLLAQECPCGTKTCINFNCPNITLGIIGADLYETTEHVKEASFAYIAAFIHDLMQELAVLTGRRRRPVIGPEHTVPESKLDNEIKESQTELPSAEKLEEEQRHKEEQRLEEELQEAQSVIAQNLRDRRQDPIAAKKNAGENTALPTAEQKGKENNKANPPPPRQQSALKAQEQGQMHSALAPQNPSREDGQNNAQKSAAASFKDEGRPFEDTPQEKATSSNALLQTAQAQSPAAASLVLNAKEDEPQSVTKPQLSQESAPKKTGLFSKAVSKLKATNSGTFKDQAQDKSDLKARGPALQENKHDEPLKEEREEQGQPSSALKEDKKEDLMPEKTPPVAARVVVNVQQDTIITDSRVPQDMDDNAFEPEKSPSALVLSKEEQAPAPKQEQEDKGEPSKASDSLSDKGDDNKQKPDPALGEQEAQTDEPKEEDEQKQGSSLQIAPAASDLKNKEPDKTSPSDKADAKEEEAALAKKTDLNYDLKNMPDSPQGDIGSDDPKGQAQERPDLTEGLDEFEKTFVPQISLEVMPALDEQEKERKQSLKQNDPDAYRAIYGEAVGEGPHIIAKDRSGPGWFARFRRTSQDPDDLPVVIAQEEEHSKRRHKKGGQPQAKSAQSP